MLAMAAGFALDPRHLAKPRVFSGDSAGGFAEYRFQLANYMVLVDPRFGPLLDHIDGATARFEEMPADAAEAAAARAL